MFLPLINQGIDDNGVSPSKNRLYYGWIVVASCTILLATTLGICYSFRVFFTSLQEEFDWNNTTISGVFSLYLLLAGVFSIIGGWATDKYGPRRVVLVMGAISGFSLLLTSEVDSGWELFLTYGVLLSMGTGATYIIVMSTGSRWFLKKRATALGIIGAGAGLGTMIMAPLSASLISSYDWRDAYLIIGIIAWAIIIPTAFLLKKDPAEIGQQVDGITVGETTDSQSNLGAKGISVRDAVSSKNFWLFFMIWFSYSFCLHMVMGHVIARAESFGISALKASSVLSLVTGVAILSRVAVGFIADTGDKKTIAIVFALIHGIAMFWLVDADSMWMLFIFAILYGLAYGGIDPPITASIGGIFGVNSLGSIMGVLMIGWSLGSAAGPFVAGVIVDHTGRYEGAFFGAGLIMVLAAFCIWGLNPSQNQIPELEELPHE